MVAGPPAQPMAADGGPLRWLERARSGTPDSVSPRPRKLPTDFQLISILALIISLQCSYLQSFFGHSILHPYIGGHRRQSSSRDKLLGRIDRDDRAMHHHVFGSHALFCLGCGVTFCKCRQRCHEQISEPLRGDAYQE